VKVPTLVVWGMQDKALLPVQLEGLNVLVDDLRVERIEDAGISSPGSAPSRCGGDPRLRAAAV
jgi:pimeloyl-ACP methyl ester carboxylesterase